MKPSFPFTSPRSNDSNYIPSTKYANLGWYTPEMWCHSLKMEFMGGFHVFFQKIGNWMLMLRCAILNPINESSHVEREKNFIITKQSENTYKEKREAKRESRLINIEAFPPFPPDCLQSIGKFFHLLHHKCSLTPKNKCSLLMDDNIPGI